MSKVVYVIRFKTNTMGTEMVRVCTTKKAVNELAKDIVDSNKDRLLEISIYHGAILI